MVIIKKTFFIVLLIFGFSTSLFAQKPVPPIPVEVFFGNKNLDFQMVVKRPFTPNSKFKFFGLATYSANYEGDTEENRVITIAQVSYDIGKGFGIMAGADINSFSGFATVVGPQHNYASKKILAVTMASFFLNEESDFKLFGLYEYKPPLNDLWSIYIRLQLLYNKSLKEGSHNISYVHLRAGLKRKAMMFGLGANIEWAGPYKDFGENYGGFVRWEFN